LTQIEAFRKEFPQVTSLMIGRGLVGDPGMLTPGGTTVAALEAFMDELLEAYEIAFGSPRNAMFRLKENWHLLAYRFQGSDKLMKRLRKTTDLQEYRSIAREIFHTLPLTKELDPQW
jgi:tRNA-dihydrouridine synthase